MATRRSAEREKFLYYLLITAIEHAGYGFPSVLEDSLNDDKPGESFAVIIDRYVEPGDDDFGKRYRITLDTMAKGLGVIRDAVMRDAGRNGLVPHNRKTGERLYFGGDMRRDLLLADRTNGDQGDYDVVGALAVLECALFGRVVYS